MRFWGSPAERAALGGGKYYPPLPANSRTTGCSGAGKAVIESSQRVIFEGILKIFFKRSQARSRSGQRSRRSLFALSATEMRLMIAENPNFAKRLLRGWRRLCESMSLILSKGQGQGSGQVRSPKWKCYISVVRHMFYGSFGTQNTMVAFIFRFDPRKRQ